MGTCAASRSPMQPATMVHSSAASATASVASVSSAPAQQRQRHPDTGRQVLYAVDVSRTQEENSDTNCTAVVTQCAIYDLYACLHRVAEQAPGPHSHRGQLQQPDTLDTKRLAQGRQLTFNRNRECSAESASRGVPTTTSYKTGLTESSTGDRQRAGAGHKRQHRRRVGLVARPRRQRPESRDAAVVGAALKHRLRHRPRVCHPQQACTTFGSLCSTNPETAQTRSDSGPCTNYECEHASVSPI